MDAFVRVRFECSRCSHFIIINQSWEYNKVVNYKCPGCNNSIELSLQRDGCVIAKQSSIVGWIAPTRT